MNTIPLGTLPGFDYRDEARYVAAVYCVSARDIRRISTRDGEQMVLARHALMWRLWFVFKLEPAKIARLMACRRQTVVDGVRAHIGRVADSRLGFGLPPLEYVDAPPI